MMRKAFLLVLLLGVAAWAAPWKIEAGQGIGPITLGGDPAAAGKMLDEKYSFKVTSGMKVIRDDPSGILFQYDPASGKIVMVTVSKKEGTVGGQPVSFTADGGVTIGAGVAQMEAAYGRDYEVRDLKTGSKEPPMAYYAYKKKGIGFQFRAGTLIEISVWPKH